jgi:hypothetical protein
MLPEDLVKYPNFFRTNPGRLDGLPHAVRPPSLDRLGKTRTAGQPSTSHQLISRFTQRIAAKLCEWAGYLVDNLSIKVYPPKHSQSWGIAKSRASTSRTQAPKKPPNRRAFHIFGSEGRGHHEKRHKVLMCDSHSKSHKETPLKPSHEIPVWSVLFWHDH